MEAAALNGGLPSLPMNPLHHTPLPSFAPTGPAATITTTATPPAHTPTSITIPNNPVPTPSPAASIGGPPNPSNISTDSSNSSGNSSTLTVSRNESEQGDGYVPTRGDKGGWAGYSNGQQEREREKREREREREERLCLWYFRHTQVLLFLKLA